MNLLIVGLGSIAKKHIDAINKLKIDCSIFALRSSKNYEKYPGVFDLFNLDECDIKFDFAIISNPTISHEVTIKKLLSKKIPLFIEKPPVSSLKNIDELNLIIKRESILTYVACNLRFHPCIKFIKKFLSIETNKIINEVNIYCASYLPDWRPNQNYKLSYSSKKELGGGVHLDLFHEFDYSVWLFGKPKDVFSVKRNNSHLNISSYDFANYILIYEKFAVNMVLNYYRRDAKRVIEIVFEDGTYLIDLIKNKITDDKDNIIFQADASFSILTTYKNQMQYFINLIQNKTESMNTFADSIEALKICLHDE